MEIFLLGWFFFSCAAFLCLYLRKQGHKIGPVITTRKEVKAANDWDEEFLRTEAAKHRVDRIEPTKYWYKTNPKKLYDGYRFHCTCGKSDYRPSLRWAELGFDQHVKDMREAALAQLGRFK